MILRQSYSSLSFSKVVVVIYMIMMSVQIIGIEGMNISPLKVVGMGCSPLILCMILNKFRNNGKVLFYVGIYLVVLIVCSNLSSSVVIWDRIFYRAMFLMTFCCVYQIINTGDISIDFFKKLLIFLVCSYGIMFVIQNLCFLLGIHKLLLINLSGAQTMVGGLKANVLAIEPSHAARILAFLYWGVVKLTEIMKGREMTFIEHLKENPYSTISFCITMIFMGSATALLGFALVMAHFVKKYIAMYVISIIAIIVLMNVDVNIETLDRIKNVINAFLSDDTVSTLKSTEASGGSRIAPIINTFTHLDLFSWETWVGKGSDHIRIHLSMFTTQRIGDINDFGLLSYIFSLLLVYTCCIRKFFCIETLLFATLLGFAIGSLYTCWCGLFVCTAIKFYSENKFTCTQKDSSTEITPSNYVS